jgi:hypothetical protein
MKLLRGLFTRGLHLPLSPDLGARQGWPWTVSCNGARIWSSQLNSNPPNWNSPERNNVILRSGRPMLASSICSGRPVMAERCGLGWCQCCLDVFNTQRLPLLLRFISPQPAAIIHSFVHPFCHTSVELFFPLQSFISFFIYQHYASVYAPRPRRCRRCQR